MSVVGLIPALVVMLRNAQLQHKQSQQGQLAMSVSGCPDTPAGIMHILEQDDNAAAAAALLALSRNNAANTTAILHQLALQLWLGHNVKLDGLCAESKRLHLAQE